MSGAEVETGLQQRLVQPVEGRIERQHHEGQVDVDEPQDHREIVVQQLQRLEVAERLQAHQRRETATALPQPLQALVHIALGAQHGDQRVGADQEVRPERQHDQQQEPGLGLVGGEGDGQGHGEADDQTQGRRQPGHPGRLHEDLQIQRLDRPGVVAERAADLDLGQSGVVAEAVGPDDRHRRQEEQHQPHQRRSQRRGEDGFRLFPGLFHRVPFPSCSPALRGSCRGATEGASWKYAELAPSGPPGHLPRNAGEELRPDQAARTRVMTSSYRLAFSAPSKAPYSHLAMMSAGGKITALFL